MNKLRRQEDANQISEAGMFYPTGYIVSGFADRAAARKAEQSLHAQGFGDDDVQYVSAADMHKAASRNLEHPSLFASTGSSMPTRQKQLELARDGHDFVLVRAPEAGDEERALRALASAPPRYAVKYRRLIIENILPDIPSIAEPVRNSRVA
ncbi:hypothetical protein [Solimonas terrae]|uniref:Uncharacterized protein n=1 Tax=Solimonas terrae TaxID=1396819 RepID=A0A6M2BWG8_9GAMM|nr:hypothetical protein [Solimonas terrae]NGY06848.1 hypothetical protein [Solimonas terrae]